MVAYLQRIRDSRQFQMFIVGCIVLAGVQVGLETYPSVTAMFGTPLDLISSSILVIFIVEAAIKIAAEGWKPWRYFYDPWNIFDFLIVVTSLLPFDTDFVTVLRLARILRVLRLVRTLPKLQILVGALLKSIPSIGYVSLLLFLLFYLYACSATFLFRANDPIHFSSLQLSMVSLFRVVTLEDWTDIMYIQMYGCANYGYDTTMELCTQSEASPVFGALFFISFVLIGTMIIMNLFIGVIMTGMEEAQGEAAEQLAAEKLAAATDAPTLDGELTALQVQLDALQTQMTRIRQLAKRPADS